MSIPLAQEELDFCQQIITGIVSEATAAGIPNYDIRLKSYESGKLISKLTPEQSIQMILFCAHDTKLQFNKGNSGHATLHSIRYFIEITVLRQLLTRKLPMQEAHLAFLLDWLINSCGLDNWDAPLAGLATSLENYVSDGNDLEPLTALLKVATTGLDRCNYADSARRRQISRFHNLFEINERVQLNDGDPWAEVCNLFIDGLKGETLNAWNTLLKHCRESASSKPSKKWLKTVKTLAKNIGEDEVFKTVCEWLELIDKPRTKPLANQGWLSDSPYVMDDQNVDLLKGLVWCLCVQENAHNARTLVKVAMSAYKKIPGLGPRLVRIGNACIVSLSLMPGRAGLYQLAVLQVKIKYRSALKLLDKSMEEAADREGISRAELEEMGVPSYGLDSVGYGEEIIGEFSALIEITSLTTVEIAWRNQNGKKQKSIPSVIKSECSNELKEMRGSVKDIKTMISVQKERIEQLFLKERTWEFDTWTERYLNHPIVGLIARKLIWRFIAEEQTFLCVYIDGKFIDNSGKEITCLNAHSKVELWHPITSDVEEIQSWREQITKLEITQPFKQAHREVYILTDAEENTKVYSNRFASHIIKQHQFNALCSVRGWRYSLQGCWDGGYDEIARLDLNQFNLWAEFWVHGNR